MWHAAGAGLARRGLPNWSGQRELAQSACPRPLLAAASRYESEKCLSRRCGSPRQLIWSRVLSSVHLDPRGLLQVEVEPRVACSRRTSTRSSPSRCFRLEALPPSGVPGIVGPRIDDVDTRRTRTYAGCQHHRVILPEGVLRTEAATARRRNRDVAAQSSHQRGACATQGRLPITALWLWGGGAVRGGHRRGHGASSFSVFRHRRDTVPASVVRARRWPRRPDRPRAQHSATTLNRTACGVHEVATSRATPSHFEEAFAHSVTKRGVRAGAVAVLR